MEDLGVDISWESGDETLARISADGSECTIVGGLVEARVSVTARITKGSAATSKTFSLVVPRITELQRINTYLSNNITITETQTITVGENAFTRTRESTAEDSMPQIEKWTFTQGPESGSLRMTVTEGTIFGTVIRNSQGYVDLVKKPFDSLTDYMESFERNKTKDNFLAIAYYVQNISNPNLVWQNISEEKKAELVQELIESGDLEVSSVNDFFSSSDSSLEVPMVQFFQGWKVNILLILGLESDATYASMRARYGFMAEAQYGNIFKTNALYAYSTYEAVNSGSNTTYPQGLWMDMEPIFESGRPWYQQAVPYQFDSEVLGASGNLYQPGSNRRGQFSYPLQSGYGSTVTVYGTYNTSYTRFVDVSNREWTVTASSDARSVTFSYEGTQVVYRAPAR